MSNASDFVIENGVLKKYVGKEKDVTIPDGVTSIGDNAFTGCRMESILIPESVKSIGKEAFSGCAHLTEITLPNGIESIGVMAFNTCFGLSGITIPDSMTKIEAGTFLHCYGLENIAIPKNIESIGMYAFEGGDELCSIRIASSKLVLPEKKLSIFAEPPSDDLVLFAPNVPFTTLQKHGLGMPAAKTFIEQYPEYHNPAIIEEYIVYIASQKKRLLSLVYKNDTVEIIKMLADAKKITAKNAEQDYLIPARQCKAEKCIAYLESLFHDAVPSEGKDKDSKKSDSQKAPVNTLWDGEHFSLDGKKLLKYPEEPGRTRYEIPKGTVEIGKNAFYMTSLTEIVIPGSVTTIRNGAFTAKSGIPLFIRLPRTLKDLPSEAFVGGSFVEDMDIEDDTKYYYVSSPVKKLADDLCLNSYKKGCRCMVYTGGPLDDLYPTLKKFAVQGFLYATQHDLEDLSKWRDSYLDHIKRNEKTYIKQALADAFLLNLMLEESLLSEKGTKTLLNEAEANGRTDLTAALLEYQQKHFGDKSNDALSLSDDDPEFKRMQKLAARREAIKDQKGIKGIVFVQTGDMLYFGYYDEYTGAKDMTDLKEFIEARGGFLRSAVSSNTDYLICNDPNSDTVKSKKAKELGVPVITEDQFLKMAEEKE